MSVHKGDAPLHPESVVLAAYEAGKAETGLSEYIISMMQKDKQLAEGEVRMTFKREARYQVVKIKTGRLVDCVVVEVDWPEYETVWNLLQCRIDGMPNVIEVLQAENAALLTENNALKEQVQEQADWAETLEAENQRLADKCNLQAEEIQQLQRTLEIENAIRGHVDAAVK
jgi:FtsZ-binding cell division protein ZapB